MPNAIDIRLVQSATDPHFTIWAVEKIWVSVQRRNKTTDRQAGITYVPPVGLELRVAFPNYAGAGPQPENTLSIQNVYDHILKNLVEVEDAISSCEQNSEKTF